MLRALVRALALLLLSLTFATPEAGAREVFVVTPSSVSALWASASPRERELLVHLTAAARALRPVVFFQTHRHALAIRRFLVATLRKPPALARDALDDLTSYAAAFLVKKGPYEELENRKLRLTVIGPDELRRLWRGALRSDAPDEIVRLMTDPDFEAREYPESADGAGLEQTGGNLYQHGLTAAEVGRLPTAPNCRVVRLARGVRCQRLAAAEITLEPEVRAALRLASRELASAARFAATRAQKDQLMALARYFLDGDAEDATAARRALVGDALETRFRFHADFLYVMYDFRGAMGKLEATVLAADARPTRRLAASAAYFEDKLPYGPYRAAHDGPPPAILLAQPVYHAGAGSDDPGLHIDEGGAALNLVPAYPRELLEHPAWKRQLTARLGAFGVAPEVANAVQHYGPAVARLVLLHELVGHGSGRVDPARYGADDPYTAMGPEGTSLEEMRANLAALALATDHRLVEAGLGADEAELADLVRAWITQYVAESAAFVAQGKPVVWPHLRGAFFLINYWLEKGAIRLADGRFSLVDLGALIRASTELLEVVQRIRATRDQPALLALYAKYAPADPREVPWVRELAGKGEAPASPLVVYQPFEITRRGVVFLGDASRLESLIPFL